MKTIVHYVMKVFQRNLFGTSRRGKPSLSLRRLTCCFVTLLSRLHMFVSASCLNLGTDFLLCLLPLEFCNQFASFAPCTSLPLKLLMISLPFLLPGILLSDFSFLLFSELPLNGTSAKSGLKFKFRYSHEMISLKT